MTIHRLDISSARFEHLPRPVMGRYHYAIRVRIANIAHMARPFVARVGNQPVEAILFNVRGDGLVGYLEREPNLNDRLRVGYLDEDLMDTHIVYQGAGTPPAA